MSIPEHMVAIALNRFGGPGELQRQRVAVPTPGATEVLIRIQAAGVGQWDPFEREGGYAEMLGMRPAFPYVLGSEGAGIVAALGEDVRGLAVGDRVYAVGFLNPRGGFYAEYSVVPARFVRKLPDSLTVEQGAAISGAGITALRGIEDVLEVAKDERVMVFGSSGGVGHLALQLAKWKGARVLAVASGADGVALAERLGADVAVDGHGGGITEAARSFGPVDAALFTAGGEAAQEALTALRPGGRVAYPSGVQPELQRTGDYELVAYYGDPDDDIVARLARAITAVPLTVHVARVFRLDDAAAAHRALDEHYLGKLVLSVP